MTNITQFPDKRLKPLASASWEDFAGKDIPKINWIIPGVLVEGGVTLFSGQGGKGKSLLCMQLQACLATGQEWLGLPLQQTPSLALYCEDEVAVIHARAEDIRSHLGCSYEDMADARFKSRVGDANELMRFYGKAEDEGEITGFFRQVAEEIELWGVRVLIIDTIADCFGGNENFRSNVRTFVNKMRSLVLPNRGGVILNAHPSRAGLADGSGLSGSTGWENSVRSRINLTEPKRPDNDDGSEQAPTDERVLKVMKNNYGKAGTRFRLRWERGVFVRTDVDTTGSIVDRLDAKAKLLAVARKLVANGSMPAAAPESRTSLCNLAIPLLTADGSSLSWNVLRRAQDTLVDEGILVRIEMEGSNRKKRMLVRPAELRFPGEEVLL